MHQSFRLRWKYYTPLYRQWKLAKLDDINIIQIRALKCFFTF
jgi:hypothetical protein